MPKNLRVNVLWLAGLSTVIVGVFAALGGDEAAPITAGVAGAALGWFATVARSLIVAPDEPTVEVPASHLERLAGVEKPEPGQPQSGARANVIILALLSTGIVGLLAAFYWETAPEIVAAAGGTVIAWFAGAARDLTHAPPEPTVEIPSSTLHALSARR